MQSAIETATNAALYPRIEKPLPRLGFVGTGWIGTHRLKSLASAGVAAVAAISDTAPGAALDAAVQIGMSEEDLLITDSFDELLNEQLDGVVIATPSSMHAEQSIRALNAGLAVFCQKPLARTAQECREVVEAARENDRLLGVDFSYRHINGVSALRELIRIGALGEVFAIDLTFHNAYGPDKSWFYQKPLSGGGCVIDLGTHLVDLLLYLVEDSIVISVDGSCFADGRRVLESDNAVEDYAVARIELSTGTLVRLSCSWNLHAGADAIIEAALFGTSGGARLRNIGGSFNEFEVERFSGTEKVSVASSADDWAGGAVIQWATSLRQSNSFDGDITSAVEVSRIIDLIYGR